MSNRIELYVESGASRVFAGALDWPGWSRSGRTEEAAIENFVAHRDRYAAVVALAGLAFPDPTAELVVVERLRGGSGADFGVPSATADADTRPIGERELGRLSALLGACWQTFDAVAARAREQSVELRKGPRGGGRDLDKIESHVAESELAYLTSLGSRPPKPPTIAAVRGTALAALAARARGEAIGNPSAVRSPWLPRAFVSRSAWHALDHAWEIEDRSRPE